MALLKDIESNFSKLDSYCLTNKQTNFIVQFEYLKNQFEVLIDKDLEYIYVKSPTVETDKINTSFITKRNISSVLKNIKESYSPNKKLKLSETKDTFGIFRNRQVFNKGKCDYEQLRTRLLKSDVKSSISISSIPNEYLFNKKQITEILINEIKKVNSNKEHLHYIIPAEKDYCFYMFINVDNASNLEEIFYIKLLLTVDPELYPYYPPSIRYLAPNAKRSFIYNMSNLELLKLENWNPVINMDWLITNLSNNIKDYVQEYIFDAKDEEVTELDKELIEFSSLIGEKLYKDIIINLQHVKFSLKDNSNSSSNNKYWNSGVGYGYSGRNEWDISKYVKEQEMKDTNIGDSITKIINLFEDNSSTILKIENSSVIKYIETNICNSTLLEINKKIKLFKIILELTKLVYDKVSNKFISWKMKIHKSLEMLRQDISPLLSSIDNEKLEFYVSIISLADIIKNIVRKTDLESKIKGKQLLSEALNIDDSQSLKNEYSELVKSEQSLIFSDYKINSNHRFYKYKSETINPKSMMRISSEFSSMRKNLPNNWDTSIIVRASSDNLNIFTFVITGPKDTPYHNGVYEFHAYFPKNYPETEPKVLLDTTGNSSVRFNPNLYNCGKVCLSLLGTWSGQDGESWNSSTSTFLQVLVSIQSLILVENPYFNEPGWERQMHTDEGKKKSFDYSDNIRLQNLKWGIIDKFKNPPEGLENFVKNHFRLKKDEILEVTQKWIDESKKYKENMEKYRKELLELYKVNDDSSTTIESTEDIKSDLEDEDKLTWEDKDTEIVDSSDEDEKL